MGFLSHGVKVWRQLYVICIQGALKVVDATECNCYMQHLEMEDTAKKVF